MHYRAFLSYSHKDRIWGQWLHRRLESFRIDHDLRGRDTPFGPIPVTLRPIFRDRDDFSSGESLAGATRAALEASDFLIVICSPNAAASRYVNAEVATFKAMGRAARIIPIIVDGEPGDPEHGYFPAALQFDVLPDGTLTQTRSEIIAADARKEGDGRDIAFQKVVAGLLGIGLDEIRKRAARAQRRRVAILSAVSVAMCGLAIGAAIAAWIAREQTILARQQTILAQEQTTLAQEQTNRAREQTILAEKRLEWALETAGAVTAKAATFKTKFGVPVPVLTELLNEVEQLIGRLAQEGGSSQGLALREARMLDALSNGNRDIGDTTKALDQSQRAAAKLETVALASGATPAMKNELAWQYLRVGDLLRQRSSLEDAKLKFLAAQEIMDALIKAEPANPAWQDGKSAALGRIIDVVTLLGDQRAAQVMSDADIAIQRQLSKAWPQHTPYALSLALALTRRGTVAQLADKTVEAEEYFKEALDLLKPLAEQDPTNVDIAGRLASAMDNAGYLTERRGKIDEAITLYRSSLELQKRISREDPLNISKLNGMAKVMDSLGYAYQRTGGLGPATAMYRDQIAIRRKIIDLDPADANQKSMLTISLARLGYAATQSGDSTLALESVEEAIRLGKELEAAGTVTTLNDVMRVAHLGMLAAILDARGEAARSTSAVEEMIALSEALYAKDPASGMKLRSVVIARNLLAEKYRNQGRPSEALDTLNTSLDRIRPDLARLIQDTGWIQIVAVLHENIYSARWDQGDFNAAVTAGREYLRYAMLWAEKDAANREAQQQLAGAHTSLANALRLVKAYEDAKTSHNVAIKIREGLVRAEPGNLAYKADLAVSWTRLADVYADLADYQTALDDERRSIALSKEIVATDPSNTGWQATMGWSHFAAGTDLVKLGRPLEARDAFQASLTVWQNLNRSQPDNTAWAANLAGAERTLAELSGAGTSPPRRRGRSHAR